jgi:hypothetical protein
MSDRPLSSKPRHIIAHSREPNELICLFAGFKFREFSLTQLKLCSAWTETKALSPKKSWSLAFEEVMMRDISRARSRA